MPEPIAHTRHVSVLTVPSRQPTIQGDSYSLNWNSLLTHSKCLVKSWLSCGFSQTQNHVEPTPMQKSIDAWARDKNITPAERADRKQATNRILWSYRWKTNLELRHLKYLSSLPENFLVYGSLILCHLPKLCELPHGLTVRGKVFLINLPSLTSLESVKRLADVAGTNIRCIHLQNTGIPQEEILAGIEYFKTKNITLDIRDRVVAKTARQIREDKIKKMIYIKITECEINQDCFADDRCPITWRLFDEIEQPIAVQNDKVIYFYCFKALCNSYVQDGADPLTRQPMNLQAWFRPKQLL